MGYVVHSMFQNGKLLCLRANIKFEIKNENRSKIFQTPRTSWFVRAYHSKHRKIYTRGKENDTYASRDDPST